MIPQAGARLKPRSLSMAEAVASGAILENLRVSFEQRVLTPPAIARVCRLDDAVEAYREVGYGKPGGKVVIVLDP